MLLAPSGALSSAKRRERVRHLTMRNRVVLKTPTGLVRGFGGPQVYFALERLMPAPGVSKSRNFPSFVSALSPCVNSAVRSSSAMNG